MLEKLWNLFEVNVEILLEVSKKKSWKYLEICSEYIQGWKYVGSPGKVLEIC